MTVKLGDLLLRPLCFLVGRLGPSRIPDPFKKIENHRSFSLVHLPETEKVYIYTHAYRWVKNRFTLVTTQNKEFILALLFTIALFSI